MKTCPLEVCECGGLRYTVGEDGVYKECKGVLVHRLRKYLTPMYHNLPNLPLNTARYEDKSLYYQGVKSVAFKRFVRNFLLLTGAKYSHATLTGQDIIEAYVGNPNAEATMEHIMAVDYLILYLDNDPPNVVYDEVLTMLLEKRAMKGKTVWVYSRLKVESPPFTNKYGIEFSKRLCDKTRFIEVT